MKEKARHGDQEPAYNLPTAIDTANLVANRQETFGRLTEPNSPNSNALMSARFGRGGTCRFPDQSHTATCQGSRPESTSISGFATRAVAQDAMAASVWRSNDERRAGPFGWLCQSPR
jgi:hypothetical protein